MSSEKDPAFLFYPADASEDTQFMNRLERGAYFDLLKAQKKFKRFSLDLIRKVLGKDFETCWPALEVILFKDGDCYFIRWADDAIRRRAEYSEKQRARIKEYWDKKKAEEEQDEFHCYSMEQTNEQPSNNRGNSFENGNGNVIGNVIVSRKEVQEETNLRDYEHWTNQILEQQDAGFEQMFMKERIPPGERIAELVKDHLALLNRYPKMRPENQQAFRYSCIKHIKEELRKAPPPGKQKLTPAEFKRQLNTP